MQKTTLAAILIVSASMANAQMAPMVDGPLKPLMEPMDKMMAEMPMKSTGNPDADFLVMMIPHHQAAIDMAKAELANGKDEATRAMAQAIIDAQTAEIADMHAKLAAMGVTQP